MIESKTRGPIGRAEADLTLQLAARLPNAAMFELSAEQREALIRLSVDKVLQLQAYAGVAVAREFLITLATVMASPRRPDE